MMDKIIKISLFQARCIQEMSDKNNAFFFTHGGWKNNNSKDIHSITCSFSCLYENIRGRSQVKSKVLDVSSVVILNTVDECPPCGGLWLGLTHCRSGLHYVIAACSILLPRNRKSCSDKRSPTKCKPLYLKLQFVSSEVIPAEMWPGPDLLETCCCKASAYI